MEVAIPVVALGALYVISNQKKKENFEEREAKKEQELPNTNVPPVNYPVQTYGELGQNVNYYQNPNAATDKYYQQDSYEKAINKGLTKKAPVFHSLTGERVTAKDLKHNNMVPFFGSHVRQRTANLDGNESILDSMQGAGSQDICKKGQAPLFKPQKNMGWAHGTPNMSDFMQSRVNPAMKMSNVKPFETQNVGPGLNRGYTTAGSGGFNAGMEARDKWISKTVDELRIKTNPKVTYEGVTLGGGSAVQNRGIIGKVEKHLPDTYYINSPERYFTTPVGAKAPTVRSKTILQPVSRPGTTREYFGDGAREGDGVRIRGKYQQAHRKILGAENTGPADAAGHWGACEEKTAVPCDYGKKGYDLPINERNFTSERGGRFNGVAGSVIGAVVAPLLDILRPSRKENVIGNMRPTGNMSGPSEMYVYNPADVARTTTRETTEVNPFPMNVNNQRPGGGYETAEQQPVSQQRDNTSCPYSGNAGNTAGTSNAPVYNAAYNATINPNKSDIANAPRGNALSMGNMNLFEGTQNIQVNKVDQDRLNPQLNPGQYGDAGPRAETYGSMSHIPPLPQGVNCQRTDPGILDAYRCNPFTHSLHSSA